MFEDVEEPDVPVNDKDFQKLKNYFKDYINSNRRFEQITTVEELVIVLEDRNALTDDILLKCEPKFVNFVKKRRKNQTDSKILVIPDSVVSVINKSFQDNWKLLGIQLKLKEDQLKQCQNAQHVLSYYLENCDGVSHQEMIFRLNQGLGKCGKLNLINPIVELMKKN